MKIYKEKVTNQGSDVSKDLCFKHYVNILMIHGSMLLQFVPLLTFCIFLGALTFTSYFCKNDANDGVDIFHIFSIKKLVKSKLIVSFSYTILYAGMIYEFLYIMGNTCYASVLTLVNDYEKEENNNHKYN